MNQERKIVKISDVVENQIPEFIFSENPNFAEFLKQYYISQEYQGATVDLAENLVEYKNIDAFNNSNLIQSTILTQEVSYFDDVIEVESTDGWPSQYGLLKIDDEIITYTGITTNTFTGCIRGFSGVESLSDESNPEYLKFSSTEVSEHAEESVVHNLSNLFLLEFFKKIKYQFSPGFEELDFDPRINAPNFISKVKSFYQTKGTDEAFKILFKVLYGENVEVIKPKDFLFTTSDDQWIVVERFVGELISGNPLKLNGQTLYQDDPTANGSIYKVSSYISNGKQYYNIDIFSGYSNNLNPKGSIFGEFKVTPKTYCTLNVSSTETTISAVSTIGFENSGTLNIGNLVVTYTDKTNTEFLNCSGITEEISAATPIYASNFVYSYEDGNLDFPVQLRLYNTLSEIDKSNTILSTKNDLLKVDSIGITTENVFTKSLIYNVPSIIFAGEVYNTIPQDKFGVSKLTGQVKTKYPHYLKNGDTLEVFDLTTNQKLYNTTVSNVNSLTANQFSISGIQNLTLNHVIKFRRKPFKSVSSQYPEVNNKFSINIQDSYEDSENYYLTSNGFHQGIIAPFKRQYEFELLSPSSAFTLATSQHDFYDGELVVVENYTVTNIEGTPGFRNNVGIYTGISLYTRRINSNEIKLAFTYEDLANENYINFSEQVSETDNSISGYINSINLIFSKLYNKTFTSSKLFKKIAKYPKYPYEKVSTRMGSIGVLSNGVEIQNYKSFDKLYYGKITSINVLDPGTGYNLLDPPRISIDYGNDAFTIVTPDLTGKIESLLVIDSGFDYIETPFVTIKGGGNDKVKTEVKMKKIQREILFNAEDDNIVILTDPINKFVFNDPHGLFPEDAVIYETNGNDSIGNLQNNSIYYIFDVGIGKSFKLAATKEDAASGIGTINITSGGKGLHKFTSLKLVNVIDEVNIIDLNTEFKYKKIPLKESNINHYDDIIQFENHGFIDGDEVSYSCSGIAILSISQYYYVIKIDDNSFKLSSTKDLQTPVPISAPNSSSIHYFSYSPIRVDIKGILSVLGLSEVGISAELYPIVTGSITKLNVINSKEYGTPIFNYEDSPNVQVITGKYASLAPIVSNGKIDSVIIFNSGQNYFNNPEIEVIGSGVGAKLHPVVVNGEITEVKIISPGIGYDQYTKLIIKPKGYGAFLKARLRDWTLNEVSKYGNKLDNNILIGQNYQENKTNIGVYYLTPSLKTEFNINQTTHSPIIGWAYDGCPIYGPYAYQNVDGTGSIIQMTSSYVKIKSSPSILSSPDLDCIEDYVYQKGQGTLDEFNGRYCVTPEYPKGVYAYFATSSFPYFIGDKYNNSPILENFDLNFNQNLDLNQFNITKHTYPYYVSDIQNYYEYFDFYPNQNIEDLIVLDTIEGSVDDIEIISPGSGYFIGDNIIFDNTGTGGFGAFAEVTELGGVGVTSISSTTIVIPDVTFVQNNTTITGIANTILNLKDQYYVNISGTSPSNYSKINGNKKITLKTIKTTLKEPLQANTGVVTSIKIVDSITNFNIDEQLQIGNEVLKIIGFDYLNNSISVLRGDESLTAAVQSEVTTLQNKFEFTESRILDFTDKNVSYYFDSDLVSVGTNIGPEYGSTLVRYPLGLGKSESKFVRTGGIWIPNHKFKHGEKVTYSIDENSTTVVTNLNGSTDLKDIVDLYIVDLGNDIIGLTELKQNINSVENLLYFIDAGDGKLHNLTSNREVVTGDVIYNQTIVSTASSHGLSVGDVIKLNVLNGNTSQFNVTYNSSTAKLLVNSLINPNIEVYRNQIVEFNTSTLSSSTFKLYLDENFENEYIGNKESGIEVVKGSNKLTLIISEYTPSKLYYNIETSYPLYQDASVENANTIQIFPSKFNVSSGIVSTTETSFTINLPYFPEVTSQVAIGRTSLSYSITKSNISGSIFNTKLSFNGQQYKKLPTISSIGSSGENAILIPTTTSIGRINKVESISNITYSSDTTLRPISKLYSVLNLTDDYSISKLNLTFGGANYLSPPTVQIYNENTNQIYNSISLYSELNNSVVGNIVVVDTGTGLPQNGNKVIFTENTNGLKILEAYGNQTSPGVFLVTLRIETPISGFSTSTGIPFEIGDKIFVEGIESVGYGFNSSDYAYNTFNVVGIVSSFLSPDQTLIRYELPNDPGSVASYEFAYVINSKNMPICDLVVTKSEFFSNEGVGDTQIVNNMVDTKSKSIIKVYDADNLTINQTIEGKSSGSRGKIIKIDSVGAESIVSSSKSKPRGWLSQRGTLSETVQKLPDNDYYQNFSYSLKSTKDIVKWDPAVSDLAHVLGSKKFSDLVVESPSEQYQITSNNTSVVNISINSYIDVNTIHDFDLVLEDVDDHNDLYSEILSFRSQKLSDYLLCLNNRVLEIDDLSLNFESDLIIQKVIVDTLTTTTITESGSMISKYISFIESTTSIYTDFELPSLCEIFLSRRNGTNINLVTYSYYEDIPLGVYIGEVNPSNSTEILLEFIPYNTNNILNTRVIREIVPIDGNTLINSYGNNKNVSISTSFASEVSPTEKRIHLEYLNNCTAGTVYVGISTVSGSIEEFLEFTFVYNYPSVSFSVYSQDEYRNLGEVGISTGNSNNIELTFTGIANQSTNLYINANLLVNTPVSPYYQDLDYGRLNSSNVQFTASTLDPVGITTISKEYGASKYVIEIEKTVGVTTERSIIQINSVHYDVVTVEEKYLTNVNYGIIGNFDDVNFSSIFDPNAGTYTLAYYPNELANYNIKFYEKNILRATNPLL